MHNTSKLEKERPGISGCCLLSMQEQSIRVYTVWHSICIFWMYYSTVQPHCSNCRILTAILGHPNIYNSYSILFLIFVGRIYITRLMRLWHLSPSVNSILQHSCAAVHWGYMSDFRSDPSSTSKLYMCERRRLWRNFTDAQSHMSLRCSPMR